MERLEDRVVPSVTIQFDYSYDGSGFFRANPAAVTVLQEAGRIVGSELNNSPAAITPDPVGGNTWLAGFSNPTDGSSAFIENLVVPANTIIVYAGGFDPSALVGGEGGPGGTTAAGSAAWLSTVQTRGQPGAAGTWGGSVSFSTGVPWSFVGTGGTPPYYQADFLTIALHELGHVLGIGTSTAWTDNFNDPNNTFTGAHAEASFGGPVPVYPGGPGGSEGSHWASGLLSYLHEPLMDATPINAGYQKMFTSLDWAGLDDIGWSTDHLVFSTEPAKSLTVGSGFGLAVSAEDPNGNVDTLFNGAVTLALGNNPGGGTLGGTLNATAVNGVATFSGLSVSTAGLGYTIQATSTGLPTGSTSTFDEIVAGASPLLAVTFEPATIITAGNTFELVVAAQTANGQIDPTFNGPITIALATNPAGGTLAGTPAVNAVGGVAVFTGLTLDAAGSGYTIQATAAGYPPATTNPFAIIPSANFHLYVLAQPPASVNTYTQFGLFISAMDPYGNRETNYSDIVTLSLASNPGSAQFIGSRNATTVGGVSDFSGLELSQAANGYVIGATSSNGINVLTDPFAVTNANPNPEPSPPAPAPPGPVAPLTPHLIRESVLTIGKGKHKHFIGFRLFFSEGLDPGRAVSGSNYSITQNIRRGRRTVAQRVGFQAFYDGSAVNLIVWGRPRFASGGTVVAIGMPVGGITDTLGNYLDGFGGIGTNVVLFVTPGAKRLVR